MIIREISRRVCPAAVLVLGLLASALFGQPKPAKSTAKTKIITNSVGMKFR